MSRMIPCLTWVKKGKSKLSPDKVQLSKEELQQLIENTKENLDELENSESSEDDDIQEKEDEETSSSANKNKAKRKQKMEVDDDDIVNEYGLDDYDDDEKPGSSQTVGLGDIANFASNEDDPYVTVKDEADSDDEDLEIKATDNLLVCGRLDDDACILEVHVYNELDSNFFVHHDYFLPTFPVVMEWLDFDDKQTAPGNLLAIGTMEPMIEIWDLDMMESVEPAYTLGSKPHKKTKKLKQKEVLADHSAAVLGLSWNARARQVLASASADTTVKLWDLSTRQAVSTLTQHTKEVQCCKFHPVEPQILLTGSFDQTVKMFNCSSGESQHMSWSVKGEVEKVIWNHFDPVYFLACTDKGNVYCMDTRKDKPVWSLDAHSEPVSGMSLSPQIHGLLVTTSEDKTMKVWDIEGEAPCHVFSCNLQMNKIHCVGCCPDAPFVFAFGGDCRQPKVWDIRQSAAVRQHFLTRMPEKLAKECEGDHQDVAARDEDEEAAATGMDALRMEEEEEEEDGAAAAAAEVTAAKKKKKKKKKKKTKAMQMD